MDFTRLRHIIAVARTRSFSRAAEEERITQPALSRSIAAFEQRHGVILFDRGRGGVHPTPAGTLVIDQAHKLLAASHNLERSLKLYETGEAGRVAFGIGPLMASLLLPELGRTMMQSRPNLQIVTFVRTPEQLVTELLTDRIEMIIGNSWQVSPALGLEMQVIGHLKLGLIVRSGHPLTGRDTLSRADLAPYPTASPVELSPTSDDQTAGTFVCDNYHILRDTVLRTDCVWLTSAAFVARELREGSLIQLDVPDLPLVETEICMIFRSGRTRSPAAKAVAAETAHMLSEIETG
ncbi:MAG TPA: LysR family transcriptional regulator [Sphingobium sp.]|uniref:LysR family transcriptional regulator n=1 Tax=Sphingobium sp. TaxID=1912891 RepID=UPI002ED0C015